MKSSRTGCSIPCNLCGAVEVVELGCKDRDGQPLRTVICQECGLVWTDPRPREEAIKKFYAEEYRVRYKGTWQPKLKHVYRGGLVARARYFTLRSFLKSQDAILDVGSGGGELVYLLRGLGYNARGIEPNEGYARYAKDELQLPIAIGFFKELSLSEQVYDVITLYHVLEHLEDPFGTIAGLRPMLKPGGHLVIEVPNVEGTCGEPANRFHIAHLYNFNPATLGALSRKAGYTVRETSISSDGGNVAVFLQTAGEPSSFDGRIQGNRDRIVGILARHTKPRHYLSARRYGRALRKAARVFDEWRVTRRFRSRAAILDATVAHVKQEAAASAI
ncbi:MAG: class I SAM-dependent methyltransferase [Verrucomicrobiota bacterium]